MRKLVLGLAALLGLTLVAGVAFAVQLQLTAPAAGGTGQVIVGSPEADGVIDQLEWIPAQAAPYHVDAVNITWAPNYNGNYFIGVTVYDGNLNVVGSGSITLTGLTANTVYENTIDLTTPAGGATVDPAQIFYVEVVILQTG